MTFTPRPINVPDPEALGTQLDKTFDAIHGLIHILREKTLRSKSSGCEIFDAKSGPCAFQVSSQYERPKEFLQTLLDLIRIMFEPNPPGTLELNSNLGFLLEEIGKVPFRLGYLTAISNPGESAVDLQHRVIAPQMKALGYADPTPVATYLMVTYGQADYKERYAIKRQLIEMYRPGLRLDELVHRFSEVAQQGHVATAPETGRAHMGSSCDAALGPDRFRLSMWLFLPLSPGGGSVH